MTRTAKLVMFCAVLTTATFGAARAEAATITWQWSGPVTGYSFMHPCEPDCGPTIDSIAPLGTIVDVIMSFDPALPAPNPQTPCLSGTASASLQVLGQTYTNTGFVWDEGFGFGPGLCVPGYDAIEVVVPSWGSGGPALPDGWVPFDAFGDYFPGLWWAGDLTSVQPSFISSQLPFFWQPLQSNPQRFTADLQAVTNVQPVPEPGTIALFGTGLAYVVRRRWSKRAG